MANIISTLAALVATALDKGAIFGPSGLMAQRPVYLLDDKAAASGTVTSAQRIRFGLLPAKGKIIPHLSWITSGHSATIAGKIVLTPTDGSAPVEIAGVTITRDAATPGMSFLTTSEPPIVDKPCHVDFVPTADTTFTGTIDVRARILYSANQ
jgi:hypothetical protein